MRAKTVNEIEKFERNLNPKAAMGIGGIELSKELWKRKEAYIQEWKDYLTNLMMGKTVSGFMHKYVFENAGDVKVPESAGWGNYSVKVAKMNINSDAQMQKEGLPINVVISDGKGNECYLIPIGGEESKIYID